MELDSTARIPQTILVCPAAVISGRWVAGWREGGRGMNC